MLAKVRVGQNPGKPVYVEEDNFVRNLTTYTASGKPMLYSEEAVEWARGGRLGSRWQMDNDMYVKVKDDQDDPFKYYTPPGKEGDSVLGPGPMWGSYYNGPKAEYEGEESCGSGGGCGGGGCGGGKKKGGCGGGCP